MEEGVRLKSMDPLEAAPLNGFLPWHGGVVDFERMETEFSLNPKLAASRTRLGNSRAVVGGWQPRSFFKEAK